MATALPSHLGDESSEVKDERADDQLIANILDSYKSEAEDARRGGPSPRDDIWRQNWDRYWGRYDTSKKAAWQSTYVMPETPQFVDRWAAAMREALMQSGRWFGATDETGQSNELSPHIERFMDILLARVGRTHDGHVMDFAGVFEDQMKLGALMASCVSVGYSDTHEGAWPSVDSVDPREYYGDAQGRNLYRLRTYQVDKHRLLEMATEVDGAGESLYNVDVIKDLTAEIDEEMRTERERSTGTGSGASNTPGRAPIVVDEWLCTLISPDGEVIASNALVIVANGRHIIRGPEENPFWHGSDWVVFCPMVSIPFSIYGRTYAEDWAAPADAFVELTNLIIDGVFTSTMKSFAAQSDMLKDPSQLDDGIYPNKLFDLEEGSDARLFMREIDLGTLPGESLRLWEALKQEMREGAKLSEIALGQVPPKGDITATEVNQVQQSGSAMIRSMARTIESRFLEPVLTLIFQTALQHMDFTEERLVRELGQDTASMLQARKEEFRTRQIKFRVRALSSLVDRQMKLQALLAMLQTFAQNELLMQAFLAKHDVSKLADTLMQLFGVDSLDFKLSQQEILMRQVMESLGGQQGGPQGGQGSPAAPTQAAPSGGGM